MKGFFLEKGISGYYFIFSSLWRDTFYQLLVTILFARTRFPEKFHDVSFFFPFSIVQMQEKLQELQEKLSGEESEKEELMRKVGQAEKKLRDRDDLEKVREQRISKIYLYIYRRMSVSLSLSVCLSVTGLRARRLDRSSPKFACGALFQGGVTPTKLYGHFWEG